ncbi:putative electron carrier [Hibiscus syriacus]|uniref:Electron carrier n=1 Tax=Hibiscus syriacus TaxID=106335 RepID=A0A6A2YKC7_HIBSY|nr:putative electron carrier [Hibiscus syriacus]
MACMRTNAFVLSLFAFLLLQQHFDLISAASRPLAFRAPPSISKAYKGNPTFPSLNLDRFTINRYKKTETEAFRPTSPGHSPGVGHYNPPSGRP